MTVDHRGALWTRRVAMLLRISLVLALSIGIGQAARQPLIAFELVQADRFSAPGGRPNTAGTAIHFNEPYARLGGSSRS
jgi:hypothetical protein